MENAKKIFWIAFVIVLTLALLIDGLFIYYKFFRGDITVGTNYISTVRTTDLIELEQLTENELDEYEQRFFMVANYYDNSNDNGIELQELQFNYSSDYLLEESFATGMQYLGDYDHEEWLEQNPLFSAMTEDAESYVSGSFNYYDTYDRLNWESTTSLNRSKVMVVSIDGLPYEIQMTGTETANFLIWKYVDYYYIYPDLFEAVMNALKSNSEGYGDFYFKMNLSKFFTVQKLNFETGVFEEDNVTDFIDTYIVVKAHYEANGAVDSSQSLFGIIDNNPSYDLSGEVDNSYWQERVVYNLTEEDLTLRYSEVYGGYLASLSVAKKALFNEMERSKIEIVISLDSEVVGLDYNALKGVEIDTLSINGEGNFYLLTSSLIDTNLKVLQRDSTVNLIYSENVFNNEFLEVVA